MNDKDFQPEVTTNEEYADSSSDNATSKMLAEIFSAMNLKQLKDAANSDKGNKSEDSVESKLKPKTSINEDFNEESDGSISFAATKCDSVNSASTGQASDSSDSSSGEQYRSIAETKAEKYSDDASASDSAESLANNRELGANKEDTLSADGELNAGKHVDDDVIGFSSAQETSTKIDPEFQKNREVNQNSRQRDSSYDRSTAPKHEINGANSANAPELQRDPERSLNIDLPKGAQQLLKALRNVETKQIRR